MADMAVTMQAVCTVTTSAGTHTANHILMAAQTFVLNNISVKTFYLQRFRKITRGKGSTVIPSVDGFYRVFTKKIVRCVAVIAGSSGMVACTGPGIEMLSHDVAVFTGDRVILQI